MKTSQPAATRVRDGQARAGLCHTAEHVKNRCLVTVRVLVFCPPAAPPHAPRPEGCHGQGPAQAHGEGSRGNSALKGFESLMEVSC